MTGSEGEVDTGSASDTGDTRQGPDRPASTPARREPQQRRTPRRKRLARGPLTIGDPGPAIEPRLAAAGDPYRPDSIADGGSALGLTVRAASVRGLAKRYTGGPRQDDLCLRLHSDSQTLIAAVADGVSGATRSDMAAALAVRHASAALARQLDRGDGELDFGEAFEQAAWALLEEHRRHEGRPDAGVDEAAGALSTTLLVATIAKADEEEHALVRVAAVGDSPAFLLDGRIFTTIVGAPGEEEGLLTSSVPALPRATRSVTEGSCVLGPGSVLLLCTDGLALPLAGGEGEVGDTLARELRIPPEIVDFARLLDFARSTYDDDRTLVGVWVAP